MFIDNKYKKWYDAIITKAQSRTQVLLYSEIHHIIPYCMVLSLSGIKVW